MGFTAYTPFECSWLQFADDAAIASNPNDKSIKSNQKIFIAPNQKDTRHCWTFSLLGVTGHVWSKDWTNAPHSAWGSMTINSPIRTCSICQRRTNSDGVIWRIVCLSWQDFQLQIEKWGSKDQDQQETSHPPEHIKQAETAWRPNHITMETGDSATFRSHSAFVRTALVWFRGHVGGTKLWLYLLPPRQRQDQPTRVYICSCIKEVTVLPRAQCCLNIPRSIWTTVAEEAS